MTRVEELIDTLLNGEGREIREAKLALIDTGEPAVPALIKAFPAATMYKRIYVSDALVEIGEPSLPGLIVLTKNVGSDVVVDALQAIALIDAQTVIPICQELKDHKSQKS